MRIWMNVEENGDNFFAEIYLMVWLVSAWKCALLPNISTSQKKGQTLNWRQWTKMEIGQHKISQKFNEPSLDFLNTIIKHFSTVYEMKQTTPVNEERVQLYIESFVSL